MSDFKRKKCRKLRKISSVIIKKIVFNFWEFIKLNCMIKMQFATVLEKNYYFYKWNFPELFRNLRRLFWK